MKNPGPVHSLSGDAERKTRLLALVHAFGARRVLVVGDLIADEFIYGEVARVSREAPVLILKYDATEVVPGGAGNAANNVAALGAQALVAGMVGTDVEGRRLLSAFPKRVDTRQIVRARRYRTPVKTRILAGGIHSAKQQVVRIDRETDWPLPEAVSRTFAIKLTRALADCDAVLLSDYGSGLVTPELAASIRALISKRTPKRAIPIVVDSRYRLLDFKGLTACTPNESEVERALDIHIDDDLMRWSARAGPCCVEPACKPCWSLEGVAGWRCSNRNSRPCTCLSSAPTKWPTSQALATPLSRRWRRPLQLARHSWRRRAWQITLAGWRS